MGQGPSIEGDYRAMLNGENTVLGLGDGGAHVSIISDASYPTFLLSYWGRDRKRDRLDVAWLVKRQTADNARSTDGWTPVSSLIGGALRRRRALRGS